VAYIVSDSVRVLVVERQAEDVQRPDRVDDEVWLFLLGDSPKIFLSSNLLAA
jgi:hypothetical protein